MRSESDTPLLYSLTFPAQSLNHICSTTYSVGLGIFSLRKLWYRGCCTAVVLSSPDIRGTKPMITSGKILGEAKRRWVPTQRRATACHAGGTTSGLCPSGALPPPCASAIGAASCPSAAARPSNLTGASLVMRSNHSPGNRSLSEQLSRLRKNSVGMPEFHWAVRLGQARSVWLSGLSGPSG